MYKGYLGIIKSNIDHNSINEFSMGVPVNAETVLVPKSSVWPWLTGYNDSLRSVPHR